MSRLNSPFVGAGYQFSRFIHQNVEASYNGSSKVYEDQLHSLDLNYRMKFGGRWQLMFQMPVKLHQRLETAGVSTIAGPGDLSVGINYEVMGRSRGYWTTGIWAGAGVALPTGKYQQRDLHGLILPPNFQIGKGSYGLRPSVNLFAQYKKLGLQSETQAHYFTSNEAGYSWGNVYNQTLQVYYVIDASPLIINLNAGIRWDVVNKDRSFSVVEANTGGRLMYGLARVDLKYRSSILSLLLMSPIQKQIPENQPFPQSLFIVQYFHEL